MKTSLSKYPAGLDGARNGRSAQPETRNLRLAAALALALAANGLTAACSTPAVVVGAGATGAVAASEERGLGGALSDSRIKTVINYHLLDEDAELFKRISTAVYEGRVLLTGIVPTVAGRDLAVRIAWRADGVKEVIDDIIVDPKGDGSTYAQDTWISAKLRSKLLFDKDIDGINYTIDTVRGTVYLLGVAQSRDELGRVLDHARNLSHVTKVVSHVILKTDPRRQANQAKK